MIALRRNARLLAAVALMATVSSCKTESDNSLFVHTGNPFFDDAASRLSLAEKKRLGMETADQLQGFYFEGQRESCIVLLPKKRNIILHGAESAYCYDKETSKFTRRI